MKSIILKLTYICVAVFFVQSMNAQFAEERKITENEVIIENQQMNIKVVDAQTKENTSSDVVVRGLNARKPILMTNISDTVFEIKNYRLYTVSCLKKGYMYYNEKFWPNEVQVHLQEVELEPLALGLKTDIRDIYFLGDKTSIYAKSKPAIDELVDWMKLNENVTLAIIGHVNGPNNEKSERFYRKASQERAASVVQYMVSQGIPMERLDSRGAGNTEMIYPDPQTNWENEANRRVEIEIIGLK